jgi:hypothetical protein
LYEGGIEREIEREKKRRIEGLIEGGIKERIEGWIKGGIGEATEGWIEGSYVDRDRRKDKGRRREMSRGKD